jgi:MFS superfamily sulfate permease-like transporter
LFFGNAEVFRDDMRRIADAADGKPHTVVISAYAPGHPDATARETLLRAQRELAERGIQLEFGNARELLRRALSEVGEFTLIDEARFLATLRLLQPPPAR